MNGEIIIEPWCLIIVQWCLIKCLDEGKMPNLHDTMKSPCTSYAYHIFWWNASINVLWIMMLVICSSKLCLVSFLPSSPGGTCTWNISCVPRAMSYFYDTLSQAMIHRLQTVLWLRKSPWSHKLSKLSDISSIPSVNAIW